MKKNYFAFVCAICALTLFSCQKEDNTPEEEVPVVPAEEEVIPDGYTQLTLSAVSDETKTTLDGTAVKWAAGDQIKVYCSDESAYDFELVGEGGSATGDFTGLVPSGKTALYAVYPKDLYSSVSSTTVNVTIPAAQEGTFGKGNIAVAKVDGEHNMAFKNVNAFVGFTVGADITKVVVSSVGGENLSGTLAVDCSGETPAAGALSDGGSSITVTFPESTGGTYYVAIAPGTTHSKGLLLTWYKGEDVSGTYWLNKAITTAANNVYDMETVSADGHYYVSVEGAGKKNGMNVANAWSASQFWSKLHPGGTDAAMDNAKLANINGATFHLAAGTYNWGPDAAINIDAGETIAFTIKGESGTIFTGDDDSDGTGDHRILVLDGDMHVDFDGITFTKGLTSGDGDARFGGGVWIKAGSHSFVDCTFIYNSAVYGGAIRFDSTGDLSLTGATFSNNTSTEDGGALSLAAGNIQIENSNFDHNSGKIGGAIDCFKGASSPVVTIIGGEFSNNTASTKGGAIAVETRATMTINYKVDGKHTDFIDNTASKYGGALDIESSYSSINNRIYDSVFKGNHAQWGGAVEIDGAAGNTTKAYFNGCTFGGTISGDPNYVDKVDGKNDADGGAIHAENDSYVNIVSSSFIGNNAHNKGGAICIKGDTMFQLFQDTFNGNHAKTGGAAFANKVEIKEGKEIIATYYPDLFIDECSFDANYVTENYGCTFNIASANSFVMHNSSLKGSYITPSQTGEKGCWIDFDAMQGSTSISNCSIIGDASSSALVWACSGSWTNHFTNNIITSSSSTTESIHSAGSTLNLSYNHIYSSTSFTDGGGNVSGKLSSDIDGLTWSNTGSSSYYWKWDGTFNSDAPTKTNKTSVNTRVNTASSAFVSWSGSDFNKDQRGVNRGDGDWWPGAYQN